jgi:hypothetical protein
MQTSFQAFLPSHLAFFHYVIFVLFACHKVNQVCTHAKVEHKIPCRSFPHDHDHEHRLYVPVAPKLQNLRFLKIPPMCSPLLNQIFFWVKSSYPIGVFPPGSAHARPSAQPPSTQTEIFLCMCLGWDVLALSSDQYELIPSWLRPIFQSTPSSQWGGLFASHQPIRVQCHSAGGRGGDWFFYHNFYLF